MQEDMRLAGIFGSAAFMVVGMSSYASTMKPLHAALYGLASALCVGFLGHRIGYILTHPDKNHLRKQQQAQQLATSPADGEALKPLTGEETFDEDIKA